jgi:hypothetical protein
MVLINELSTKTIFKYNKVIFCVYIYIWNQMQRKWTLFIHKHRKLCIYAVMIVLISTLTECYIKHSIFHVR